MSKNFEVLQQLQEDIDLFRVPPVAGASYGKSVVDSGAAFVADELEGHELLRLARRVFLNAGLISKGSPRKVVFCGVDEAQGTSLLCARLARKLALQVSSQVCVVDANLRLPMLHRHLELEPRQWPQTGEPESLQKIAGNLWLMSGHLIDSGETGTASLDQIQTHIDELPPEFDYVVINAPPIGVSTDAVPLGQKSDGVVLVVEANSTRRVEAHKSMQEMTAAGLRVLGIVLNNRTFPIPSRIYRML